VFCLYTQRAKPFADDKIGDMQVFSLVVQSFTLIYALMLTIDELTTLLGLKQSFTQTTVRNMMGAFVVFLNSSIVAFPWIQKMFKLLGTYLEQRQQAKSIFKKEIDCEVQAGHRRDASKWNNSVLDSLLAATKSSGFVQTECNSTLAGAKKATGKEAKRQGSNWIMDRKGNEPRCPAQDDVQEIACDADKYDSCRADSQICPHIGEGSCEPVHESYSLLVRNNPSLTEEEAEIPCTLEKDTGAVAKEAASEPGAP
jgi:hypothetical protein